MQKIYVSFFLGLVFLLGGLNFGLYKYNEADKHYFISNSVINLYFPKAIMV